MPGRSRLRRRGAKPAPWRCRLSASRHPVAELAGRKATLYLGLRGDAGTGRCWRRRRRSRSYRRCRSLDGTPLCGCGLLRLALKKVPHAAKEVPWPERLALFQAHPLILKADGVQRPLRRRRGRPHPFAERGSLVANSRLLLRPSRSFPQAVEVAGVRHARNLRSRRERDQGRLETLSRCSTWPFSPASPESGRC